MALLYGHSGSTSNKNVVSQCWRGWRIFHRNNVPLVRLPKATESGKLEPYFEILLKEILNDSPFSNKFVIERAHRSLGQRPAPGASPRPILMKFLNYRDRDVVLRRPRELGTTHHEGSRPPFFLNFIPAVQKSRKSIGVQKILRSKNIMYNITCFSPPSSRFN